LPRTNIICIGCPKGCQVMVESKNGIISNISGYRCPVGKEYARKEFSNPTRILPTTVKVIGGDLPLVPVKTLSPIPKDAIEKVMLITADIELRAPVKIGQVICEDLAGTGVKLVATRSIRKEKSWST